MPLLLPSVLGIFVCIVCMCSMTWAWFQTQGKVPSQMLVADNYEIEVLSINAPYTGDVVSQNADGTYHLVAHIVYTVELKAVGFKDSGSSVGARSRALNTSRGSFTDVEPCSGYCIIRLSKTGETVACTPNIVKGNTITYNFSLSKNGDYAFVGALGTSPYVDSSPFSSESP